jgi:hypothetical protein
LRNAVVPRRTPGCGPTFTIRAWSLRTVTRVHLRRNAVANLWSMLHEHL